MKQPIDSCNFKRLFLIAVKFPLTDDCIYDLLCLCRRHELDSYNRYIPDSSDWPPGNLLVVCRVNLAFKSQRQSCKVDTMDSTKYSLHSTSRRTKCLKVRQLTTDTSVFFPKLALEVVALCVNASLHYWQQSLFQAACLLSVTQRLLLAKSNQLQQLSVLYRLRVSKHICAAQGGGWRYSDRHKLDKLVKSTLPEGRLPEPLLQKAA